MKKLLALSLLLAATTISARAAGWADTEWGMSVAEVRRLHRDAVPPVEANEKYATLIIPDFRIETDGALAPAGSNSYKVRFFFNAGGLRLVTLTKNCDRSPRIEVAQQNLRNLLVEKYGAPSSANDAGKIYMWNKTDLVVKLVWILDIPSLSISYEKPDMDAIGKL